MVMWFMKWCNTAGIVPSESRVAAGTIRCLKSVQGRPAQVLCQAGPQRVFSSAAAKGGVPRSPPVVCAKLVFAQMYAMQSIELIAKFLKDRLGVEREQVVESAVLVDLGVDSLMLAELMFEAEDSLGISIDSNVEVPKTVGDMVQLLDGLLAEKASAA